MKVALYLLRFISSLLFSFLSFWVIFNSSNLVVNSSLLLLASVIIAFSKAIIFNKNTKEIRFKTKEAIKLFFTEELIKDVMIIAFTLWYKKFVSGLNCFLIILSSFILLILLISLYYWMLEQKRAKKLTK